MICEIEIILRESPASMPIRLCVGGMLPGIILFLCGSPKGDHGLCMLVWMPEQRGA